MHFSFPSSTFINIGGFEIKWYAILIIIGAGITYLLIRKAFKNNGYDQHYVDNLFLGCFFFGIIGARLWYCAFSQPEFYFTNIMNLINIRSGGLAIHGGLLLGGLFGFIYTKKNKMSFLRTADAVFPYILIAQAIGRWGNFFNQEAYGAIINEEAINAYPYFIKQGMLIHGNYREPAFLIESCYDLLGFLVIALYRMLYPKRKRGDLFALYLFWYGFTRFMTEGMRVDNLLFMGFRISRIVSIVFMLVGVIIYIFNRKRKYGKPVILFDLDGTLLDTEPGIIETYKYLFRKYRTEAEFDKQKQMEVLGPPLDKMFMKYFPEQDPNKLIAEYREHNFKIHPDVVKPMKNAQALIEHLKKEGYKIGIVSTKMVSGVKIGLDLFDMTKDFDVIIGHDSVEKDKPDPSGILAACKAMNVGHDNCIYVGDSYTDIEAAKNAGVYSIGYIFNQDRKQKLLDARPNCTIEDLNEIIDLLKENKPWTYNSK